MNIDPRLYKQVAAHPYPLLFATISGAHLYGFPSPDSDFDLRGVHLLPLRFHVEDLPDLGQHYAARVQLSRQHYFFDGAVGRREGKRQVVCHAADRCSTRGGQRLRHAGPIQRRLCAGCRAEREDRGGSEASSVAVRPSVSSRCAWRLRNVTTLSSSACTTRTVPRTTSSPSASSGIPLCPFRSRGRFLRSRSSSAR